MQMVLSSLGAGFTGRLLSRAARPVCCDKMTIAAWVAGVAKDETVTHPQRFGRPVHLILQIAQNDRRSAVAPVRLMRLDLFAAKITRSEVCGWTFQVVTSMEYRYQIVFGHGFPLAIRRSHPQRGCGASKCPSLTLTDLSLSIPTSLDLPDRETRGNTS